IVISPATDKIHNLTEKIQPYKTNQKLQNHENQLHQFRLHRYRNPSYRRMRINDSGPEYATLGHCEHSGVVSCLLRVSCSRKRYSLLPRPAPFHHLWSRRWWHGRPKDLCYRQSLQSKQSLLLLRHFATPPPGTPLE